MRKSRFTEKQIVGIPQEYAAGGKLSELCRKQGLSDAILYKWKRKYGGLQVSELHRLKDLKAENAEGKCDNPGSNNYFTCSRATFPVSTSSSFSADT